MRLYQRVWLIILFFACLIISSRFSFAQNNPDPRSEIYPKLRDRRCTTMTLAECSCSDAKEMKAYIDALIETGVSKEEIFYKVAKRFSLNMIVDKQIKARVQERLIKESGGKIPQIVLEPGYLNLGQVSKKEGKIARVFKLYNKGTAELVITNIKVSCTCVTVSLSVGENKSPYFDTKGASAGWKAAIDPGKSGELEVIVDLAHSAVSIGKLTRDINITSNDIINPEVSVRIEGEVKE